MEVVFCVSKFYVLTEYLHDLVCLESTFSPFKGKKIKIKRNYNFV